MSLPFPFDRSVFINCPFDEDFSDILQTIAFCVIDLGFYPRLAPENSDSSVTRLDRIIELIRSSKYGIHDLSRSKSITVDEYSRLNMPFELGIDYGCRIFGSDHLRKKSILVLETTKYDYQKSLSDISGWDICAHDGDYKKAIRHVRNWLVRQSGEDSIGAARIEDNYYSFGDGNHIQDLIY